MNLCWLILLFESAFCSCLNDFVFASIFPKKRLTRFIPSHSQTFSPKGCTVAAFETLDIVKIFGRLADNHITGACLGIRNSSYAGHGTQNPLRWKWEDLFKDAERDKINITEPIYSKSISLAQFSYKIRALPFRWPLTPNTGHLPERPTILVPTATKLYVKQVKDLRSKNKRMTHNNVVASLEVQAIPSDAIECVFKSLGQGRDRLNKTCVIQAIQMWAPADGLLDWYTFVYNLNDVPVDSMYNYFD